MSDLTVCTISNAQMQLKKPEAISFSKPNPIHPFDDSNSLAFWSSKNDASLFAIGMHSKKRPNNLVFARTFNNSVMDMMELGIEKAISVKEARASASAGYAPNQKPLFHFSGELFETLSVYQQFKSVILDFFHGDEVDKINLAGLEHVISCSIGSQDDLLDSNGGASTSTTVPITSLTEPSSLTSSSNNSSLPLIHFRTYSIKLLNSGSRIPLVSLEHAGPSFDFKPRRVQAADPDVWKQATKKHKKKTTHPDQMTGNKKRKDRNIDIDEMGDKVGKLHMAKQDLQKIQTRKMKGLKKTNGGGQRGDVEDAEVDEGLDEAVDVSANKRVRI
jgi:ribosome production factor 2